MRCLPLLLLALTLCTTGCRDSLVDEPPGGADAPPPTETDGATARSIYVKGTADLRLGDTGHYRAEPLEDVARYVWVHAVGSTGSVVGTPTDPLDRLYDLTGETSGVVYLQVTALDAQGKALGIGTKTIQVAP